MTRFERATLDLEGLCSTTELHPLKINFIIKLKILSTLKNKFIFLIECRECIGITSENCLKRFSKNSDTGSGGSSILTNVTMNPAFHDSLTIKDGKLILKVETNKNSKIWYSRIKIHFFDKIFNHLNCLNAQNKLLTHSDFG